MERRGGAWCTGRAHRPAAGPRAVQLPGRAAAGRLGCEQIGVAVVPLAAAGPVFDDHISWPTATQSVPDLAWDVADGYTVNPWIDGKEKVYGSIP